MAKKELKQELLNASVEIELQGYGKADVIFERDFDELIEKLAKKLPIYNVSKRFSDPKFIDNVCISYRHDFGLLSEQEKDKVRFECKEWLRAIKNNEPY